MPYVLQSGDRDIADYIPYGGSLEFIYDKSPEVIIEGPAETGKTLAACWKVHAFCSKYAGAQVAIVRKVGRDIYGTVLQTFDKIIEGAPIEKYGGKKVEQYRYKNGTIIWIGGMDNPGKVLSSERDLIYANQTEEFKLTDWELMTTRTTGRSAVAPYTQLLGDVNPSGSKHWILDRHNAGKLKLVKSRHIDNPTLYKRSKEGKLVRDENGKLVLTPQGIRTMTTLQNLTGVRRKRLFEGKWATAEGAVYDMFNPEVHVKVREEEDFEYFGLALDEGYTNPAVILVIGIDPQLRLHILREFYETQQLQETVVKKAVEWTRRYRVAAAVCDKAAAGLIADLLSWRVPAHPSKGRVLDGIHIIQDLLGVQPDGLPRLTVDPSCVNTINEFESYLWKPDKDEPIKDDDHCPDAVRYFGTWLYEEVELATVSYDPVYIVDY